MSDYTMTAILVVNGQPIIHSTENRAVLYQYLIDNYGPLYEDKWAGRISTVNELYEWCDIHAGIASPCITFVRDEYREESFDFYILSDPWYLYEIDNPDEKAAIEEYCSQYGLEAY